MSGLLAKLVARAHGTLPEVAPRPVSRFENDGAGGELEIEETLLDTAPSRRLPPPVAAPPPATPPPATPPATAAPTPAERTTPAPPVPTPPPPGATRLEAPPAEQPAQLRAAPSPAPPPTLRQVEHHQRIEREVRREIVRASDPSPGQRPHAPIAEPAAPAPAPAPVTRQHLVEIVERITGHPPAPERRPERVPAPQPTAMPVPRPASGTPIGREVPAPALRRPATTRRAPEPAPPAPVHVHIDRIEVRTAPAPTPRTRPPARQPADTAPSLQAFLAGNKAGGP
jgi:hypothetical protein